MPSACDLCAAGDRTGIRGPLAAQLGPDRTGVLWRHDHAVAVPTIGAFAAGYLLIVPDRHTTSLGLLPRPALRAAADFTAHVTELLTDTYQLPVVGFEYGLNSPDCRRIEHGHLHLLPSPAGPALCRVLDELLPHGYDAETLADLPADPQRSYIAVTVPGRPVRIHPVSNQTHPRPRLRQILAAADPRVRDGAWDWQRYPFTDQIRATYDTVSAAARNAGAPSYVAPAA